MLEAVMPVASKDAHKINHATRLLLENTDVSTIHVVSDEPIDWRGDARVVCHHERDVLPFGSDIFDIRSKWLYQQMIKLCQEVTAGDWYVSVDADTFVISRTNLFENGRPRMFKEVDPNRRIKAYDRFNRAALDYSHYPFSALNNIVLFNKAAVWRMIADTGETDARGFASLVNALVGPQCYPAEAQLYLSWLLENEPDMYDFDTLRIGWRGMYDSYKFSEEQVEGTLAKYSLNTDLFLLHSWETVPEGYIRMEYET